MNIGRPVRALRASAVLSSLFGLVLLVAGCSTARRAGAIAVSRDGTHLTFTIALCEGYVDSVNVALFRTPGMSPHEKNVQAGQWRSSVKIRDHSSLDATSPGPTWTTETDLPTLVPGQNYIAHAFARSKKWDTEQVDFSQAALDSIPVGKVLFRGKASTQSDFVTQACPK